MMNVSLIITTYNAVIPLELCLESVLKQTILPNEILIADDGSTNETRDLIASFQQKTTIPIKHIWHEDNGFRLTVIRNKAIAQCSGDYIIQIDGDLIVHPQFVADHIRFAEQNCFVGGSRVSLSSSLTQKLQQKNSIDVSCFTPGAKNFFNGLHCNLLSNCFANYKKDNLFAIRGCNMAFWKKDLVLVNGYNEDMIGWGREDTELVSRLCNANIRRKFLKFGGIVFHQFHETSNKQQLNANDNICKTTIETKSTFCNNGLNKYV